MCDATKCSCKQEGVVMEKTTGLTIQEAMKLVVAGKYKYAKRINDADGQYYFPRGAAYITQELLDTWSVHEPIPQYEEKTGWINIYPDTTLIVNLYSSKAQADDKARKNRCDCIQITYKVPKQ